MEGFKCRIIWLTGLPDAPIDLKLAAFKVEDAKTVSVNVSWTPGYSGGYDQMFTIHYRVKEGGANFVEQSVGHPDNNMHTIEGLLPETEYEFTVQASNQAGKSEASASKQVMTPGTRGKKIECSLSHMKMFSSVFVSSLSQSLQFHLTEEAVSLEILK